VIYSVDKIEQLMEEDQEEGENRLYGIVLLSDGKNEIDGGPTENDMLSHLPSGTEARGIKIYTIAYGDDADLDLLKTLANRTNGKQFTGDVEDIEAVYFLISSEF
jgi:Ca-activated chloride channel family protein